MAKVKAKVSKEAMEEAADRQPFEETPPGMYVFDTRSAEVVESKKTKVDQVELVLKPIGVGKECAPLAGNFSQLWDYVQLEGESTEWKRAQFCTAYGIDTAKDGSFTFENDARKPGTIVGQKVMGRVIRDKGSEEYRPKIAGLFPYDPDAVEESTEEATFTPADGDDEKKYSKKELKTLVAENPDAFKKLMKEWEIKTKGRTPKELIELFLTEQDEYFSDPV